MNPFSLFKPSIRSKAGLLLLSLSCAAALQAQNIPNPVLRGVADAGCIRYAGQYYLGGVATYGDFFVSRDLVSWNDRIHVFDLDNEWTHGTGAKNNQVHADDISYSGGLFHLLFSVNYWGQDRHIVHITHATSPTIEGPYREVRQDQWYENRIDPQVFQDDDGRLYLYMVKFTDGNTIWGRALNPDFSFAADAVQQFSSQPGTWETLDNRVAEGPFVIKYRGRYYMMYNANHTAPEYGNYHLGVCEAPSPLAFNPGGKYPYPVVGPNTEPVDERYTDLLRYGADGYNAVNLGADQISFQLDRIPEGNIFLLLAQRGGCRLWLNGHSVNPGERAEYAYYPIAPSQLRLGLNTITVSRPEAAADRRQATISHLHLYATGQDTPDEVLVTPGQPNIVRGPNGWEWWLVYMANQGWSRHQFVDRIHFVNNRMTVDGPTGAATPGFHPAPALPQYEGTTVDGFPVDLPAYLLEITSRRDGTPEEWRFERNGEALTIWKNKVLISDHQPATAAQLQALISQAQADETIYCTLTEGYDEHDAHFSLWQSSTGQAAVATQAGITLPTAENYFHVATPKAHADFAFSAQFDNSDLAHGHYGVDLVQDAKNHLRITIDAERQLLVTEQSVKGKTQRTETPLAETLTHYPDLKYTDSYEKQYRFDSQTLVSAVEYPHLDASHDGYAAALSIKESERVYRRDMAGMMTLEYLDPATDRWLAVDYREAPSANAAYQRVEFAPVATSALRMINRDPRQNDRNIYRVRTTRQLQASNQLRIEKRGTTLHIFLNTRQLLTLQLPASLFAPATPALALHSDAGGNVTIANAMYYVVKE